MATYLSHRSSKLAVDREQRRSRNSSNHPSVDDTLASQLSVVNEEDVHQSQTLTLIVIGLCFAVFLLSVDRTIISTAIPFLSDEFHEFSNFGWYGSAYLLTSSVLQPLFGHFFDLFNIKWTYLVAILIFNVGSTVSATATNATTFIVGRAITGIGSAGLLSGAFIILVRSVPLEKRPIYTAGIGIFYSLGSVAGPLLGGVFTSRVTWRWCFWFNLPVSGFSAATLLFYSPVSPAWDWRQLSRRFIQLDWIGLVLLFGSTLMFFMALNYADAGSPWSNSTVIGTIVGSGASMAFLVYWQLWRGEYALIPLRKIGQCGRTAVLACCNAFFVYSTLLIHVYFLSIWFQIVQGRSALEAGVDLLPYISSCAIATILAGIVTTKTSYFAPPAWFGCGLAMIGAGLLTNLHTDEATGYWIGYSIVAGFGVGFAIQQPFTAVQAVLPRDMAGIGSAIISFFQAFGAAIFLFVGNTIFTQKLRDLQVSGINIEKLVAQGPTMLEQTVDASIRTEIVSILNMALRNVFIAGTATSGVAFLSSLGLELVSLKEPGVEASRKTNNHAEI